MNSSSSFKISAYLCWLGWVFDFYDLILIAFLIKVIEQDLGMDPHMGSWLLGIGLGASGIGGILFGWLANRYGRKQVLTWTVLLFSAGMLLTGFVQTPLQFMLARFVTGLGLGGEWAVGHALIAESVPAQTRGRWSAFLQSGEPVGVAIAAVMGFMIAPLIGWRTVFIGSAITGLLALAFRRYLKESPLWESRAKKQEIPSYTFGRIPSVFKTHGWVMLLAFILAVFKLGTYWTCYTWLPRFIQESSGQELGRSTLWILCGQLGQFLGMYAFGSIADTLGRRWAFTLFSLITAIALLPLALYWDALWQTPVQFWGLLFLLGFGSGCTAGFGALLSELFPTAQRTLAMGTVYNMARGVQLFSPLLVALAVDNGGLTGGLLVPTSLALCTAIWVWTLPEHRAESLS